MVKVFDYPEQQKEFERYVSENGGAYIWHDGAVMRVYTGEDIPAPPESD